MVSGPILGVILAGGQTRRMGGGDKALVEVAGRPLIDIVCDRLGPQVDQIVINSNSDPAKYDHLGIPVIPDTVSGFVGPLGGVLTGLEYAASHIPAVEWIVTVATDTPFFPDDLVARFSSVIDEDGAELACASSNERNHPVFGM